MAAKGKTTPPPINEPPPQPIYNDRRMAAAERQRQAIELCRAALTYEQIAVQLGCSVEVAQHAVEDEALRLRGQAFSYVDVGVQLGLSTQDARTAVKAALDREELEDIEQVRKIETRQIDGMLYPLLMLAQAGSIHAADQCVKLLKRKAQVLGSDADGGAIVDPEQLAEQVRVLTGALFPPSEETEQ